LCSQHPYHKQGKGRDRVAVASLQPIELAPIRQLRKRFSQVMRCIPVKRPFDFRNCPHCPNRANVITSLRFKEACGPGFGLSGSSSDWQKSSTMTYSVVMKVSRSIISELLFLRLSLVSSLYDLDFFFIKSFLFHTKRLRRGTSLYLRPCNCRSPLRYASHSSLRLSL